MRVSRLHNRSKVSASSFNLPTRPPRHRAAAFAQLNGTTRHGNVTKGKPRIAVDVDEVLGLFLETLCQYCREEHDLSHDVDEFWVYEFAKVWNCNQETSNHLVHEFFKSRHFRDGIAVMPGAFEALSRLKESHDLVVVTSRQHAIKNATLEWLDTHYPSIFSGVHFGNHFAQEGVSRKKSEICRDIGAEVLIDDNPRYAYDCASCGISVLLYNWNLSYPWSDLDEELAHPRITVVQSWDEIEACLQESAAL